MTESTPARRRSAAFERRVGDEEAGESVPTDGVREEDVDGDDGDEGDEKVCEGFVSSMIEGAGIWN